MKAEELSRLWQDGLREAYGEGQAWDRLSDQQKAINIRVATKVLEHITIREDAQWIQDKYMASSTEYHAACVSDLQRQVKILMDEVFCTHVDRPATNNQTILGDMHELRRLVFSLLPKEQEACMIATTHCKHCEATISTKHVADKGHIDIPTDLDYSDLKCNNCDRDDGVLVHIMCETSLETQTPTVTSFTRKLVDGTPIEVINEQ